MTTPILVPADGVSAQAYVTDLRSAAQERAARLAAPTARDEAWRFTNPAGIYQAPLQASRAPATLTLDDIAPWTIAEAGHRMVFVDGVYAPHLGRLPATDLVTVCTLAQALQSHPLAIAQHLGQHAADPDQYFTAGNTAALQDAAVVLVPRHSAVAAPVHVLFVATRADTRICARLLVVAGEGSTLTLVEDYVATVQGGYLTNTVAELAIAAQAQVLHIRVQRESEQAFHIARCAVSQGPSSQYHSIHIAQGAEISRLDATVVQNGEGAHTALDGLAYIGGQQVADTHTCLTHARAHGTSRQLHKCIVADTAHAVFNGRVQVKPNAQKTDSSQSSRTLLLGPKAQINTLPQLEINADDVRCTHGATVGQLDSDEVFYLQSRGLSMPAARQLLTYGFAAEIIDRIPIASLRNTLQEAVQQPRTVS